MEKSREYREWVTADMLTTDDIQALRASFPLAMEDEFAVEYANGERGPIGERLMRESREVCAALVNDKLIADLWADPDARKQWPHAGNTLNARQFRAACREMINARAKAGAL